MEQIIAEMESTITDGFHWLLQLFNELFDQNNFRTIKTGSKKLTIEKRLNKSFDVWYEDSER